MEKISILQKKRRVISERKTVIVLKKKRKLGQAGFGKLCPSHKVGTVTGLLTRIVRKI